MASLKENYRQVRAGLGRIKSALVLAAALPRYFRHPITVQQAEEETKRLLDTRVERFLELVRTQIYDCPGSPYLRLLKHAGCELSDLQTQVHRHGLEETLVRLAGEGVYLTSEEFKGKKDVVRGGQSFRVSPGDFARRPSSAGLITQSSGTANAPVSTFSSLEWRALRAMGAAIRYSAIDIFSYANALYEPILAGRANPVLTRGKLGLPLDRWFVRKIPAQGWLEDTYNYLATYLLAMMGTWFGPGIAKPEILDEEDVRPIVEWILAKRREGKRCSISTVASNAVRIARRASEMGVSLEGTTFTASGEPLTESKRAVIERAGARTAQNFHYGGNILAGLACGNPRFAGEVHVEQGLVALVEHPQPLDDNGPPIYPLLATTLHPMAPRLLLNVENGDYGTMVRRDCGCLLEKVGFTQHLHTIRSFEKFTSEGMQYFTANLFGLLEKTMPSEFGGEAGDYQLVEEEDDNAQTRLTLLVHPNVGEVNEERLLTVLQEGLVNCSTDGRAARIWQAAGTLRIRRQVPYASPRGKILPFHIRRSDT